MKEEDLSLIKRYPIVEYLERKDIKPVRRTPSYALIKAGFHVEDMNIHYKDFKDLNEYHVSCIRKQEQQKVQERTRMSVTEQNQNRKSKQVKLKMK